MKEILLGDNVEIIGSSDFDKDFCVHKKCKETLLKVSESKIWQDLPDGPLRKIYEQASQTS